MNILLLVFIAKRYSALMRQVGHLLWICRFFFLLGPLGFFSHISVHAMSVVPAPSVYLPGIIGKWYVIAYLPGRALPDDCLDAVAQNRLHMPSQEAEFESVFSCVRKNFLGKIVTTTRTNLVRIPRGHGSTLRFNEIPFQGRLEMDPGAPIRWFIGWVDYWILEASPIELSTPDAFYVVGGPKGTILTIFSRAPRMDESMYQQVLHRLQNMGYQNLSDRLIRIRR